MNFYITPEAMISKFDPSFLFENAHSSRLVMYLYNCFETLKLLPSKILEKDSTYRFTAL